MSFQLGDMVQFIAPPHHAARVVARTIEAAPRYDLESGMGPARQVWREVRELELELVRAADPVESGNPENQREQGK